MQRRLLAITLLLTACASTTRLYEGPELLPDQVVLLKQTSGTRVVAIDGIEVSGWSWELAPGLHTVVLSIMGEASGYGAVTTVWMPCALQFHGAAGDTYVTGATSQQADQPGYVKVTGLEAEVVNSRTGERFSCTAH